jgi:hypothetical protein
MFKVRYVVFALALGGTFGCSSSDSKTKDETSQTAADSVTVSVSAADGGEVKLGNASLKIPGGALSEDLEVTLDRQEPAKSLPDQETLQGMTYDFGPNGTKFEKPVELTLPIAGTPSKDEIAVISWYDEASKTWKDLEATVKGGAITAEVMHFTLFVVRFKGVAVGAFDCGFEPCGSEGLPGTWKMDGACVDTGKQDNPFAEVAGCEDAVFDVGVDAEGEVTFTEDTFDYHWSFTGNLSLDLSSTCIAAVGQGKACEEFNLGDSANLSCTTAGDRCKCTGPAGDPMDSAGAGTYVAAGDDITFTKDGDDPSDPPDTQKICVKGDQLKIQQTETELDSDTGEMVTKSTLLVLARQ